VRRRGDLDPRHRDLRLGPGPGGQAGGGHDGGAEPAGLRWRVRQPLARAVRQRPRAGSSGVVSGSTAARQHWTRCPRSRSWSS